MAKHHHHSATFKARQRAKLKGKRTGYPGPPPHGSPPIHNPTTPPTPPPPTDPHHPQSGTPTPPPGPPTPPPKDPFQAFLDTNQLWNTEEPKITAGRGQTYAGYGWLPVLDASGKPVLGTDGLPQYKIDDSGANPYSVLKNLQHQEAVDVHNSNTGMNNRGLLYSGANVLGALGAQDTYARNYTDQYNAFLKVLQGFNSDETSLLTALHKEYNDQAPPAGTGPPPPTDPHHPQSGTQLTPPANAPPPTHPQTAPAAATPLSAPLQTSLLRSLAPQTAPTVTSQQQVLAPPANQSLMVKPPHVPPLNPMTAPIIRKSVQGTLSAIFNPPRPAGPRRSRPSPVGTRRMF